MNLTLANQYMFAASRDIAASWEFLLALLALCIFEVFVFTTIFYCNLCCGRDWLKSLTEDDNESNQEKEAQNLIYGADHVDHNDTNGHYATDEA